MTPFDTTSRPGWSRRRFLVSLVAIPVGVSALAACGDDATTDADGAPGTSDAPGTGDVPAATAAPAPTSPPAAGPESDEVVLRIDRAVGAFTTQEFAFWQIPDLLVLADGRVLRPGAQIEIFPQPLLPAVEVAVLPTDAMAELVDEIVAAGMTEPPPDYDASAPQVADVGSTVVTVTVDGVTQVHQAFALGIDTETDPQRVALGEFVDRAISIAAAATDAVPFEADEFEIWAQPANPSDASSEPAPTVQPWPADTGIVLASAAPCVAAPADAVIDVLTAADQLSWFTEGDVTYRLIARPVLPGGVRCTA